ncbi:MAG TPA: acyl-CoA dehydrogenase family protein [Albitalea sp.]|uniref:acyl-CoA dehydrogenase family protein n=1 Tax=Piscinibacter sp. TaxID=1903157 RepID=UPI002ED3DBDC
MNLGFTTEHDTLRGELGKLLARADRRCAAAVHGEPPDAALWQALAAGGWLGTAVPLEHGGSGLDGAAVCVLAEEAGRALVALPLVESACAFVQALRGLPSVIPPALWHGLAEGRMRGLLIAEDDMDAHLALDSEGRLRGRATQLPDGPCATHALLLAHAEGDAALVLASMPPHGKAAAADQPLDLLHPCCDIDLSAGETQVLARGASARSAWSRARDAQALFVAFEQLGGAQAALDAARAYSLQRYAFGRPIGSFQALKHQMADMLAGLDIARSNCLYGLAALSSDGDALGEAAAVARISATEAYRQCAAGSTQVHGAIGVSWEADCHLHYRRAQALAHSPGSQREWKDRLVRLLQRRADASPAEPLMT